MRRPRSLFSSLRGLHSVRTRLHTIQIHGPFAHPLVPVPPAEHDNVSLTAFLGLRSPNLNEMNTSRDEISHRFPFALLFGGPRGRQPNESERRDLIIILARELSPRLLLSTSRILDDEQLKRVKRE